MEWETTILWETTVQWNIIDATGMSFFRRNTHTHKQYVSIISAPNITSQ